MMLRLLNITIFLFCGLFYCHCVGGLNTLIPTGKTKKLTEILNASDREADTVFSPSYREQAAAFVRINENCTRSSWYCYQQCRLRNNFTKPQCLKPAEDAECFGNKVTYLYVTPDQNVVSQLERYKVLRRFPKCWAVLAPLICAITYRPCTIRASFQLYGEKDTEELELWQLLRWNMCDRAMTDCLFLREWGLWPEFVNCSNSFVKDSHNAPLFADRSCQMNYKEDTAKFGRSQCLWPLIKSEEKFRDAKPLVDDCYLPCQSTLVSSVWTRSSFKMKIFGFSAMISAVLLLCFIYLSVFSEVWLTNICAYILGHSTFASFLYHLLWALSYFNWISESAMCFGNGELRRTNNSALGKTIGWCGMQSFLMQSVFFSAYFWLCAFFIFCIGRPRVRADHKIVVDGRPDWSLRCILLVLYLLAAIVALPAFWTNKADNDGLLGVCYVGLLKSEDRLWTYIPIVSSSVFALLFSSFLFLRNKGKKVTGSSSFKSEISVCAAEHPSTSGCNEPRFLASSDIESQNAYCKTSEEESVDDGFASGQISETPEKEELIFSELHVDQSSKLTVLDEAYCSGSYAVPPLFLGAILLLYVLSLLLSMVIHVRNDWNPEREKSFVLESQRCSLNASIRDGKTEWFNEARHSDEIVGSIDPLVRKKIIGTSFLNARGCDLLPVLDDYFYPSFMLHIVVPSLPFLAVAALLITGWCGIGFKEIEKIREHINPFVRTIYSGDEAEVCVSSWCDNHSTSKRPFSSADCLDKMNLSSSSLSSQINSEPVKLSSSRSRVRKLDFKRLAKLREENAKRNSVSIQSTGGTSCLTNEKLNLLSSQQSCTSSLGSEVPSIYSHVFPRSCNTSSFSQVRDSNLEAATVFSAYQTGLVEGFWQQVCREYSGKIDTLVGCLQQAEEEIRRLSGQSSLEASEIPLLQPGFSPLGLESRGGLPFVGLSLLRASVLGANSQVTSSGARLSDQNDFQTKVHGNSETSSTCSGEKDIGASASVKTTGSSLKDEKSTHSQSCERERVAVDVSKIVFGSPPTSTGSTAKNCGNFIGNQVKSDDQESKGSIETDSNSFFSDEEDEEEARLWEQKSAAMSRHDAGEPSNSQESTPGNGKLPEGQRTLFSPGVRNLAQNAKSQRGEPDLPQRLYTLPSLKPQIRPQRSVGNGVSREHPSREDAPRLRNPEFLRRDETVGIHQDRGSRFGNSRPLAAVAGQPVGTSQNFQRNGALRNAGSVQPLRFTEEQARGLLHFRSQLTGQDLLFYSQRLREQGMRILGNQDVALNPELRRPNLNQSRSQAQAIPEEDEEVPDPFSNSDGLNNRKSGGEARK